MIVTDEMVEAFANVYHFRGQTYAPELVREALTAAIALMRGQSENDFGSRPMDAIDADNGFRRYPWTYQNQPGNVGASALGACARNAKPGGDSIDHGLSLLRELHLRGFGIVRVPTMQEAGK